MKIVNYAGAVLLFLLSCSVFAYRQPVHMNLTKAALDQSVLANNDIWNLWGVTQGTLFSYQTTAVQFHPEVKKQRTYSELFDYGVDAEDTDEGATQLAAAGGNATGWSRAFNHFFNPQVDKKLDLFGIWQNDKSPVWSLETAMSTGEAHTIGHQNFSYADAQEYYYMAFAAPTATRMKRFRV